VPEKGNKRLWGNTHGCPKRVLYHKEKTWGKAEENRNEGAPNKRKELNGLWGKGNRVTKRKNFYYTPLVDQRTR